MSRRELKARGKVTQKMSRDGLVERNAATGEDKRVSKRDTEFDLREKASKREATDARTGARNERTTLSQVGKRSENAETEHKKPNSRHKKPNQTAKNNPQQLDVKPEEQLNLDSPLSPVRETDTTSFNEPADTTQYSHAPPPEKPHTSLNQSGDKRKLQKQKSTAYQQQPPSDMRHDTPKTDSPLKHEYNVANTENMANSESAPSDVVSRNEGNPPKQPNGKDKLRHKKKTAYRNGKPPYKAKTDRQQTALKQNDSLINASPLIHDAVEGTEQQATGQSDVPLDRPPLSPKTPDNKGKFRTRHDTAFRQNESMPETDKPKLKFDEPESVLPTMPKNEATTAHTDTEKVSEAAEILSVTPPKKVERQESKSFEPNAAPVQADTAQPDASVADKPQTAENPVIPKNDTTVDNTATEDSSTKNTPKSDSKPEIPLKHDKPSKLKFEGDKAAPDKPKSRKLVKAEKQAEKTGAKLEKAKKKLPAKHKLRSERVFDETKGKSKRRLYFEKEVKTQGQHLKGALLLRPVKAVGNTAIANAHRKIYQVEHENVSVKAAHRAEMLVEGGVRSALRFHKIAPYRKVTKLEKQAAKKTIKLNYQKALSENPKLSSNMLSRMWQKRKIKKDYAKKAREAQKAAQKLKQAGSMTARATKALASVITKHPIAAAVIMLFALLLFILMSLFGLGSAVGSGGLGGILTASYLAEDADIDNVELSYTEWETDLQYQIVNVESNRPGYNEYRYEIGDISHNPYELMAYLTAVYQNFPYDAISGDLRALFDEQYSLTFIETTEIRYADPTDANEDGDYEPYEWKILTVSLVSRSFSDVIIPKMTVEQQQHYAILIQTKGSRQYAGNPFDVGWLPYVTSYYGWRVHPITGAKDLHRGVDIAFPAGTEIRSAQDGMVTFAGYSGDYGNVVIIENDKGLETKYAHCESLLVSVGQTVTMGDVIATVGNTGASTGAHLHLEVLKDGQYANPLYFVDTGSFNLSPVYGEAGVAMGDGSYAALIEEAERHLGKPYVYGSNGSNTFDCSSFICYILTQSGVQNMPRTTAQGIYNQCTPIPESEARPGDLVMFHSTYSTTNTVTHIGLYVGVIDGHPTMIHAGSPVQYTRIDTAYWQSHLYAFARLN